MDEILQDDISVMYVESANGAEGAQAVFDELERHLAGTQGRRFYGTYDPATNVYRACVALKPEDDAVELRRWVIPGGKYSRRRLDNWAKHLADIGKTFMAMSDEAGEHYDANRSSIEFYRSHDHVILLLPVK
jgi:hypothetical protein